MTGQKNHEWKTLHPSHTLIRLAVPDILTLTISSVLKSGVQLVEEYYNIIVDYRNRTHRYLKAAGEYERSSHEKRKSNYSTLQKSDTSITVVPSRQEAVKTISTRAGLCSEEIPYLALGLEGAVRGMKRWTYGDSL